MKLVATRGIMEVWERNPENFKELYIVRRTTDKVWLEEFRDRREVAIKWAKENKKG